jgi:hypothetical protein
MTRQYKRILKHVEQDNHPLSDTDIAMLPVEEDEFDKLDMYTTTEAAKVTVESIRRKKGRKGESAAVS